MNCLIMSNMGPSKHKPALGRFVTNQFDEIFKQDGINASLFLMPEQAYEYKSSLLRYFYYLFSFIYFCTKSKVKFDIIHIHFFYPTVLIAYLYKLFFNRKVQFVATFHGTDVYAYSIKNSLYKYFIRKLKSRIYVSNKLAERHRHLTGRTAVISAGILNIFSYKKTVSKKYDFIFVGNLERVKGADRLLRLISENPDKTFLVIGNGAYAEQFNSLKGKGLTYIKSATPEMLCQFFNESFCLVNLSRNESFGLVITEALSCGLPVIATKTDGALEQLVEKNLGVVIEQSYSNCDIQQAFNRLTRDNSEEATTAKTDFAQQYQLKHIAKRVISEYKYAIEKR